MLAASLYKRGYVVVGHQEFRHMEKMANIGYDAMLSGKDRQAADS